MTLGHKKTKVNPNTRIFYALAYGSLNTDPSYYLSSI